MSDFDQNQRQTSFTSVPRAGGEVAYDEGLRKHMLGVYNYMGAAIALTGIVAFLVAQSGLVYALIDPASGSPSMLYWASIAIPFVMVMWLQMRIFKMSVATAQIAYWAYAVMTGISISFIFIVYTPVSIAQTFLATAIAFAGLSLWGYTTKKDLSGWGSFLIMGIWGGIGLSLLNVLFFQSSMLDLALSFMFLLMFAGFTAYKTQETREIYLQLRGNAEMLQKATIYGALHLYMSFISIFMNLLRFMGSNE